MMRSIIAYVKLLAYSLREKYVIFEENQYNDIPMSLLNVCKV